MRDMKNLNALLMSLLMTTMLTASCKANTHQVSDGSNQPLPANDASTISPTSSMTAPRSGHTANLLPNGQVLIAGGYDNHSVASAKARVYKT